MEIAIVERVACMDEIDLECTHCGGLTAHRSCENGLAPHCVHCGNPLGPACKVHKDDKSAEAPRYAKDTNEPT